LGLRDPEDFPALYKSADRTAVNAQGRFLNALRTRLAGLLVAVVGGAISWSVGSVEVGGTVSLVAFALAIAAELNMALVRPDRAWYEGRAAAESAKTLTWRYVVRGESFSDINDPDADRLFLRELQDILQDLDLISLDAGEGDELQITNRMRTLRHNSFKSRRELYLTGRIHDQRSWYSKKARWNETRGRQWTVASVAAEFVGLVCGAAKAFGGLHVDLAGVLAAIAATITAWVQAKQHQNLATAYGVTAQELASVASELVALTNESDWADFVGRAEEAISREHTLWRGFTRHPHPRNA